MNGLNISSKWIVPTRGKTMNESEQCPTDVCKCGVQRQHHHIQDAEHSFVKYESEPVVQPVATAMSVTLKRIGRCAIAQTPHALNYDHRCKDWVSEFDVEAASAAQPGVSASVEELRRKEFETWALSLGCDLTRDTKYRLDGYADRDTDNLWVGYQAGAAQEKK